MATIDARTLQNAIDCGMIDADKIRLQIEMYERNHYLEMHDHNIWQGKNGGWYTYLPDATKPSGRRLIRKTKRCDLDDCIVGYYKHHTDEPRIRDVFELWIEQKLSYGEIKRQSYDRYKIDFDRFFSEAGISKVLFRHITEDMLEDFIKATIHDFHLTSRGWGNLKILLNGIFRYGKKNGYTAISISSFLGDLAISRNTFAKHYPVPEANVFKPSEVLLIKQYIAQAQPSVINLGILLGFETGLRIGEIAALKPSDLDLYHHKVTIQRMEVRYKDDEGHYVYDIEENTKTEAGHRIVVLSDEAVRILEQVRKINPFTEYLFTSQITGKRLYGKNFTNKLYDICLHVGIRKRSMHKTRKTFATKLINSGIVKDSFIQKQMGHTDIETTRRYYYFDDSEPEEAVELMNEAMKFDAINVIKTGQKCNHFNQSEFKKASKIAAFR